MNSWYWVLIGCAVIFVVWQLWWTRQHGRNLDAHGARMDDVYRRHSASLRWGSDPERWPAWDCANCSSPNVGRRLECGCCEKKRVIA